MKRKSIIYGLVIVVIVGGLFVLRSRRRDRNIVLVRTAVAEVGDIKAYLSTTATIESKNSKDYFGTQAKVKKVNVKLGEAVKKGDVLIEYESQDLDTAVKQAQLQYDNAVLQRNDLYNQNKSINDKISELDSQIKNTDPKDIATLSSLKAKREALSPISYEKLKQADNAVSLAQINLDSAKKKLEQNVSSIVAENDGVVTALNVVEGQMGSAAQIAVTVQDTGNLKAVISLGKYDANRVKVGQDVIIKSGSHTYSGKVSFIEPAASKSVSAAGGETSLGAEIDILDKAEDLKINFDVDVDILIGEVDSTLKVPAESIKVAKGNKNYVYVIEDGVVREREIKTNIQSDMEVGITEGIKQGDKVVLNPSTAVKDGTRAKESVEVE
ncbi:efflux RND transporter periplasmic adaptor subunit [Clostridium thermarum]|uniref:efflux RND transporter periplasmic adaptor subunit n=1 Tax=Clostridium thermarum TaxID=1716543 RepID=UPI00111DF08A|nr:efflux RND transporter periplasmic adaptor subunit [Clostridium thermarum]